ncbi:hypothetical protein FM107_16330 [Sphingobacterium sp. JB170]|nr:hypothetical protein FM107_16330 [Sphingobacterium sp. JB170]
MFYTVNKNHLFAVYRKQIGALEKVYAGEDGSKYVLQMSFE